MKEYFKWVWTGLSKHGWIAAIMIVLFICYIFGLIYKQPLVVLIFFFAIVAFGATAITRAIVDSNEDSKND